MASSGEAGGAGQPGPVTGRRLKKLLDERRLTLVGSASAPARPGRVVVAAADEVDPPDHQQVAITTR